MGAVDQMRLLGFERLGGGDIGEDHEFLDHLVGVEAWRGQHAIHCAVVFQQDLALGQVEIERRSFWSARFSSPHRRAITVSGLRPAAAGWSRPGTRRWRPAPVDRTAWPPSASSRGGSEWPSLWPPLPMRIRRRSRDGPRLAEASRGRWKCARAAWARRGRGNRPNCRDPAPRGRAGCPDAHKS